MQASFHSLKVPGLACENLFNYSVSTNLQGVGTFDLAKPTYSKLP